MQSDQLFINDKEIELASDTVIALTMQINDLAEIKDRNANHSQQFKAPPTQKNIEVLGWSNMVQSTTSKPYLKNGAKVVKEGVQVVGNGYMVIEMVDKVFNLTVYSGLIDFFESIKDRKLSELDLSVYTHVVNIITMVAANTATSGYKYPIVQTGDLVNTNRDVQVRNQRIAFFVHTLIDKIFAGTDFNKSGAFFSDPNYLKMLLRPTRLDNDQHFNRSGLTLGGYVDIGAGGTQEAQILIEAGQIWEFDYSITFQVSAWSDGVSILNFDNAAGAPLNWVYNHPDSGGGGGTGEFTITQTVSGTVTSLTDLVFPAMGAASCTFKVLRGRWKGRRLDGREDAFDVHIQESMIYVAPGVGFNVALGADLLLPYHANLPNPAVLLPDMTQADLIKTIANQYALFFARDIFTNTIYAARMEDIIANIPHAVNWSDKLHDDDPGKLEFRFHKYARKNWLKYKDDSGDKTATKDLGDGYFEVDDENLQPETTIIEVPFAATGNALLLKNLVIPVIDQIDDDGNFSENAEPRLLLDDTQNLSGDPIHYTDEKTSYSSDTNDESSNIPFCYFQRYDKAFSLGFDRNLLEEYYSGLTTLLNRAKKLTRSFKLDPTDIARLNTVDPNTSLPYWFTPIYLWQFNSHFYLNKVISYVGGNKLTKAELIRLGGGDICVPEFGPEILLATDFPSPNVEWQESGDIGVTFTYGIPGVQKDSPGSFAGQLTQFFAADVTSPVGKFKTVLTVTGRTQGSVYVSTGGTNGTARTTDGTFTEILNVSGPNGTFVIYQDADFDGVITLASLKAQLTCPDA